MQIRRGLNNFALFFHSSVGFCLLVDLGLRKWRTNNNSNRTISFLLLLLLSSFALKTSTRNLDWSDRGALFSSGLRAAPRNAKAHYNYGNFLRDSGGAGAGAAAAEHYRQALKLWPQYAPALNNLAAVLVAEGATAAASSASRRYSSAEDGVEVAQDAVAAAADADAGHSAVLGRAEAEAELLLLAALRANPGHANSLFNVAILRR